MKDLYIFLVIMVALFGLWFYTGGPERHSARSGPFIKPPAPLGTGETYGGAQFREGDGSSGGPVGAPSSKDVLEISSVTAARENASLEFIELRAPYTNRGILDATNWRIGNSSGVSYPLGRAAKLPQSGTLQATDQLLIAPGDRVVVATGRSPVGVSFQENLCTGYFEQFNDFNPMLSKTCPNPETEYEKRNPNASPLCLDYLDSLSRCTVITGEIPSNVERECADFARNELTYTGCLATHQGEKNFYKQSWRVFLGRTDELWTGTYGLVLLYNPDGGLIDTERYR